MSTPHKDHARPLVSAQDACAATRRGDLPEQIAERLRLLSPQAIAAFALVLDRFELGQRLYGAPSATRDWKLDTLEELLDLCVYRGLTLACAPQLPVPVYSCTFPSQTENA